jgi:acyl carrier protein
MTWKFKEKISKAFKTPHHKPGFSHDGDQLISVEQKIKAIMAKTFKVDINLVTEDTSSENLDRWTSLAHVDLVLNLQQAFDLEFTDSQIVEALLSYKTIVQTVEAALKERGDR